jgi:hypothetical protein
MNQQGVFSGDCGGSQNGSGARYRWFDLSKVLAILFVLAMIAMIASLRIFLREVF